jgi:hypothetical protein
VGVVLFIRKIYDLQRSVAAKILYGRKSKRLKNINPAKTFASSRIFLIPFEHSFMNAKISSSAIRNLPLHLKLPFK